MLFLRSIFFIIVSLFFQSVATASEIIVGDPTMGPTDSESLISHAGENPGDTVANLISYGLGIVGVLAVLAATWAAVQMIIASGDEEKMKKSRQMIIYAFVGVVVAGLGYGAVKFIMNLNLNNF